MHTLHPMLMQNAHYCFTEYVLEKKFHEKACFQVFVDEPQVFVMIRRDMML